MSDFRITEKGPKVQAIQHHDAELPACVPGQHLWVVTGAWKVNPRPNGEYQLDTENLLSLAGPGCFWCERNWSPSLEAQPCESTR